MLDSAKNIKIVDFGLSEQYEGRDEANLKTNCGSIGYAAPEILLNKNYNGLQVDLWSSGIILYAMLAGKLPFDGNTDKRLAEKIVTQDYKMKWYFSESVRDLIKNILVVDPQERYTIKEIKKHKWYNSGEFRPSTFDGIIVGTDPIPVIEEYTHQI